MGVRLERHLGRVETMEPKQYTTNTMNDTIAIRCPQCEQIADVPETHVPPRGSDRLRYVWSCPNEACPFWEFVTLNDYLEDS